MQTQPLQETAFVLDEAIRVLGHSNAEYRTILKQTEAKLSRSDAQSIKEDLDRFLRRVPAASSDFKCNADFLRRKARQEMVRLKEILLTGSSQPAEAEVCYAAPFAVDMRRLPDTLEIYGYDFDRVAMEMFLVDPTDYRDVSFALAPDTHYHVTFKLREKGVDLTSNSRMLGVTWGHLIHFSIPVIQPESHLCASKLEEVPAGNGVTFTPDSNGFEGLPTQTGATFWADVELDYQSNGVNALVCAGDRTQDVRRSHFGGCGRQFLFTIDPDRTIESILGSSDGRIAYSNRNRATEVQNGTPADAVQQWTFVNKGDAPELTIAFKKIRFVSRETEDCIPAIAYLEARRRNSLSSASLRILDAQMQQSALAASKLRPRFAPR
jgi:hypothetical protein